MGVCCMGISDESTIAEKGHDNPIVCKNYFDVHFKLNLPIYMEYSDHVEITSVFNYQETGETVDSILEKCKVTDAFKRVHSSVMDYQMFLSGTKNTKFSVEVPTSGKRIYLKDSKVELTFLCSNQKKIVVTYFLPNSKSWKLQQISIYKMSDSEREKMQGIRGLLKNKSLSAIGKSNKSKSLSLATVTSNVGADASIFTSPSLEQFSEALKKEISFLKQGRGKKYKVVNGEKLHKDNQGIYTYTFEMETELHLPDDAPVTVETAAGLHASGSVLVCDDFQITLMLNRDLNDRVRTAYITVEPWKLLESLDKKMNSLNPDVHRLAIKLMEEGPKLAGKSDITKIPKGQPAVISKLKKEDIVVVWGPPGTGKIYTMAMIAIDYLKRGKSVLIVSHSNVSVDGVIKQVLNMPDTSVKSYLQKGSILRYGYVRDTELANHEYATSFNYALAKNPTLRKELDVLSAQKDKMKAKNQIKTDAYHLVEKNMKGIREAIRKEEKKYAEKARILGTTISKATIDGMFEDRQYDLVMFDEVSMAYVPQIIAAAALAREKFMCVGDFRQLSPIAQSTGAKPILQRDIFSYLRITDNLGKMYGHPWLVMLNEQRRMHPDISAFPNRFVYQRLLKNDKSVLHNRDSIVASAPLPGDAMNLIDLTGTYCAADKNSDNSRFNLLSAVISFSTAVRADQDGTAETVGIITPYAAQTRLIRAMLRDYYPSGTEKVSCATVHQYQGSESDVLIFDAVESYPTHKVGFLLGKDMDAVIRLINVAVTRARGKLITVANVRFWQSTFKGTNHIYYRLLEYLSVNHNVVNHAQNHNLKSYIESVNPDKMIRIYTEENEAIAELEKDIKRAKGRVVLSIPDGNLRETEERIIGIIDDAYRRGVAILMKSNGYQDLPDTWKTYCFGADNAVFPLLVIDDRVVWYGLPTSRLRFQVDKTTGQDTVVPVMVRIDGDNTVEMIKALTNLEMIKAGINTKPLLQKKGASMHLPTCDGGEGEIIPPGLGGFVEEKEFCPKCKSHLILTRNAKGMAYLKCSGKDCDTIKYLGKELMNWYIIVRNVCCPKDGGCIEGAVGRYGPYIRCDRGHFLKPWEI